MHLLIIDQLMQPVILTSYCMQFKFSAQISQILYLQKRSIIVLIAQKGQNAEVAGTGE